MTPCITTTPIANNGLTAIQLLWTGAIPVTGNSVALK